MNCKIELWCDQNATIKYSNAMVIMDQMHAKVVQNREANSNPDTKNNSAGIVWFLEHDHVYTTGNTTPSSDLLNPKAPVQKTTRGGKATYHGPGQRVVYLVLDLKKLYTPNPPDIKDFVLRIENWVIASLKLFGVESFVLPQYPGVWCRNSATDSFAVTGLSKIAAIGLKVRNFVTYHGVAININPDMSYFADIIPCGIREHGLTSVAQLLEQSSSIMELFDQALIDRITTLGVEIESINFETKNFPIKPLAKKNLKTEFSA